MRATSEDFQKVASVGQEQIVRALETTPSSLEQFKTKLQTLTYCEITQLWQLERNTREEWESHAKPVVELREQITPEILGLIKQQRLAFLVEGMFILTFKWNNLVYIFYYSVLFLKFLKSYIFDIIYIKISIIQTPIM